ncbi:hypothetical protein F5Y00DRAFT_115746 [Daldinia vernicosa]|uniref:uncharacterized protein n=1 Tax=Daldinia vernicosa TaxID=114800 RepID=UPI002007FC79|nr:uncharacterized protein F5Y00DRAFT_115746 [Daldinia vernicosa]KAI0847529.1 hypothetical protein F5Y00DRAFT_115746 [Daldinia vernicosa]
MHPRINIRELFMEWLPPIWERNYLPFYRSIYAGFYLLITTYLRLLLGLLDNKSEPIVKPIVVFSQRITAILVLVFSVLAGLARFITHTYIELLAVIRQHALSFLLLCLRTVDSELYRVMHAVIDILMIALQIGFWLLCLYSYLEISVDSIQQPDPLNWAAEKRMNQYFHNAERQGNKLRWRHMADDQVVRIPNYVFH